MHGELNKLLPSHRKFFSNWRQEGVYIYEHYRLAELGIFQCVSGGWRVLTVESSTNTLAFGAYIPIYGHKVLEDSAPSAANQKTPRIKFTYR